MSTAKTYCIKDGYTIRPENDFSDEKGRTDECQDDVYSAACELAKTNGFESVLDIGTGGGFKLLKYFREKRTLGIDLEPNIEWVRTEYPDREWSTVPLTGKAPEGFDLIIAADVIEHLLDPDELLDFIAACKPKAIVISTPNRDNLQGMFADGPPKNLSHVREWTGPEFREYLSRWFEIDTHWMPPPNQTNYSTMYIVGRPRQ